MNGYPQLLKKYNETQWVQGSPEQLAAYAELKDVYERAQAIQLLNLENLSVQDLQQQKANNNRALFDGTDLTSDQLRAINQANALLDQRIEQLRSNPNAGFLQKQLQDPTVPYGFRKALTQPDEAPEMNAIRQNQANLATTRAKFEEGERRAAGEAKRNVGAMAGEWTETEANQAANLAAEAAGGEAGAGTAIARMQAAQQARNQVGAENIQRAQERKDKYEMQQLERAAKTSTAQKAETEAELAGVDAQKAFSQGQEQQWMSDYAQRQRQNATNPSTAETQANTALQAARSAPAAPLPDKPQAPSTETAVTENKNTADAMKGQNGPDSEYTAAQDGSDLAGILSRNPANRSGAKPAPAPAPAPAPEPQPAAAVSDTPGNAAGQPTLSDAETIADLKAKYLKYETAYKNYYKREGDDAHNAQVDKDWKAIVGWINMAQTLEDFNRVKEHLKAVL
jgi:hypothetical protein